MSYIETERLILRTWMHSDLDALVALYDDPDVCRFVPGLTHSPQGWSEWIEGAIEEQEREGFSPWPVVRKSDGRLIGSCGLHRSPGGAEITWVFERAVWRSGYGTEAARAVLDYARDVAKLPRVAALVDLRDSASIALVNRVGMRFDCAVRASKRDVLRYLSP